MTKPDPLAEIDFPPFLNLDRDLWRDFVAMRKKKGQRAPLTERAASIALRILLKLETEGYSPNACLEQTILNGWSGIFPTKDKPPPKPAPDGKPRVLLLNNFLVDLAEHKAKLADPEVAAKVREARLAAMAKCRPGRAS